MAQLVSTASSEKPARRFKFRQAIRTDVGLKREENQDAYGYAHASRVSLFVVADGMGGARGGATASALAVDAILRTAIDEAGTITEQSLRDSIIGANTLIFEHSKEEETLAGMGTTVVALALVGEKAIIAHVGDSRIYRVRGKEITQLTRDHTLVQELVDSGSITPEEAVNHPIAHMLTRSLGPTQTAEVDAQTLSEPLQKGDKFLLCCDGLYNLVSNDEIQTTLNELDLEEAVEKLVGMTLERGAPDNVTVEIVEAVELGDTSVAIDLPEEGKIRVVTSGDFESDALKAEGKASVRSARAAKSPAMDTGVNGSTPPSEKESQPNFNITLTPADLDDEVLLDENDEIIPPERLKQEAERGELDRPLSSGGVFSSRLSPDTKLFVALGGFVVVAALGTVLLLDSSPNASTSQRGQGILFPQIPQTSGAATSASQAVGSEDDDLLGELQIERDRASWPRTSIIPQSTVPMDEGQSPIKTEADFLRELEKANTPPPSLPPPARISDESETPPAEVAVDPAVPTLPLPSNDPAQGSQLSMILGSGEVSQPQERARVETRSLLQEKDKIREEIADIDAKLWRFELNSLEKIRRKRIELESKLKVAQNELETAERKLTDRNQELSLWQNRQKSLAQGDALTIANEIAGNDEEVKRKRDELQLTQLRFRQAVELFDENQGDPSATSSVTALGREVNIQRAYLEQAIRNGIDNVLQRTAVEMTELLLQVENLKKELDRINRHMGILDTFSGKSPAADKQQQRTLLQDRARLGDKLIALRAKLSDEDELLFRRQSVVASVYSGPSQTSEPVPVDVPKP